MLRVCCWILWTHNRAFPTHPQFPTRLEGGWLSESQQEKERGQEDFGSQLQLTGWEGKLDFLKLRLFKSFFFLRASTIPA